MTIEIIAGRGVGLRRQGRGADVVMIHCALAHSGAFAPLMGHLAKDFSMTGFDLPGHGQTGLIADVDIHDQACDIALELLNRADQPCYLIGHSFGATVALRLAVEHPELISGIFLYEPVYFALLSEANQQAYAQEAQDSAPFVKAAMAQDWRAAAQAFLARWNGEDFNNLPEMQQAYLLKTIPLIMAGEASIISPQKTIFEGLRNVTVPVLLMAGGRSPGVVHHIIKVIASQIPHALCKVIPDAAHLGPISHSEAVAKLIVAHLKATKG